MSPFLHQWLTATQYIAPLMANFDLGVGNSSDIFYQGFGECCTICRVVCCGNPSVCKLISIPHHLLSYNSFIA